MKLILKLAIFLGVFLTAPIFAGKNKHASIKPQEEKALRDLSSDFSFKSPKVSRALFDESIDPNAVCFELKAGFAREVFYGEERGPGFVWMRDGEYIAKKEIRNPIQVVKYIVCNPPALHQAKVFLEEELKKMPKDRDNAAIERLLGAHPILKRLIQKKAVRGKLSTRIYFVDVLTTLVTDPVLSLD